MPNDPKTLADFERLAMLNASVSGFGVEVVNHIPCPFCAAAGWLDFPITAALTGYAEITGPRICASCGREGRLDIHSDEDSNGSMSFGFVQIAGPPPPAYLPPMKLELKD